MSTEDLLQNWLPRLWDALKDMRQSNNAAAQETIYELYVEMKQQTLTEKLETFSEITLEDQLSAMALELQATQKRVAELENGICQRAFEAKQEQGEPDLIECGNCHEGLADMEHVCKKCLGAGWVNNPKQEQGEPVAMYREKCADGKRCLHGCHTNEPCYTTPQQRTWVGLDPEEIRKTNHHMVDGAYHYSFKQGAEWAEATLKERNK